MKVRIEFDVPNWTRWAAAGVVVGTVFGYAIAAVHASVSVPHNWQAGDVLTAAALNENFRNLQDAINAQQATLNALSASDCPAEYARDSTDSVRVVCIKGQDQVVKVGAGRLAFWVDRYEASIWDQATGAGKQYGAGDSGPDYPVEFPRNGRYAVPLFAVSQVGVHPASSASWFQAVAACEASGKRLPRADEWLRAVKGTIDPGLSNGSSGACHTDGSKVRNTGLGSACVSEAGAQDMIGNLWEFTLEWHVAVAAGYPQATWPGSEFNADANYGVGADGLPMVQSRGGSLFDAEAAGIYALDLRYPPFEQRVTHGFRCVIPQ